MRFMIGLDVHFSKAVLKNSQSQYGIGYQYILITSLTEII